MQTLNAPGMTKWTNPLGYPVVKLHLHKHPPVIIPHPAGPGFPGTVKDTGFLDVEIEPGDSCWLPSGFDNAIQKRSEDGMVQSGECPWLIKNDGERPNLHPSLDPVEQQRLQAGIDAEKARIKAAEAEVERARAEQSQRDAERQQRENEERARADQAAREKLAVDQAEAERMKAELAEQLAQAKKATAAAEKAKAKAEKELEQLTKPAEADGAKAPEAPKAK